MIRVCSQVNGDKEVCFHLRLRLLWPSELLE